MRSLVLVFLLLLVSPHQPALEPTVRIGLTQNASSVTVRSAEPFTVEGRSTRSAAFASVLAIDTNRTGVVAASDLQPRVTVTLDDGAMIVMPVGGRVRIEPVPALLQIDTRAYRGALEIFLNTRRTLTVVNELPLETYLLGVVPNELNPTAFGQLEALEAQAVAARTYIYRNMGQYRKEGYDICATDACQVYFGALTEDPLATQAVVATRGEIAVYDGKPINALYSSTCGGRTEDAEHIFNEKVPYLVSTTCEYKHPDMRFSTSRAVADWKDGVLAVAGVKGYGDAARFMGLPVLPQPGTSEPEEFATYIRRMFYPSVLTTSDLSFLREQGILNTGELTPRTELLFRLIDKKSAFEWQQGVLVSFDTGKMQLMVGGQLKTFALAPDALVYHRVGDSRLPLREGSWIGGELVDFRAEGDTIPMLVYRINFANPAADRYSRLALWQTRRTKAELDAAFRSLAIGEFTDMRVIQRGESERLISTEIVGTTGRSVVPALRLRTLLGVRDSLFSYDIERNASGRVVGATFFGRGWGHGVGMCQVGAYGMALAGARHDEILKKYYAGIELQKMYLARVAIARDGRDLAPEDHERSSGMPEKKTLKKARKAKREGKAPTTQAGPFVEEEIEHIREGKHGARSTKQAIAIGLSKARRAGVKLQSPPKSASERTKRSAKSAAKRKGRRPSASRSRASRKALKGEPRSTVSRKALSRQATGAARRRSASARKASAKRAAKTRARRHA